MSNTYFQFREFIIQQAHCAMKVTTDSCLFGAFIANEMEHKKIKQCLDIGTGSGLLSLMLAQKNNCLIDAIEMDEAAVQQARENFQQCSFGKNINLIHADVNVYCFTHKYDLIISNPPFYENELLAPDAKKNIAHHSSHLSFSNLLVIIQQQLTGNGIFYLLLPFKRLDEIKNLISKIDLQIEILVLVKPNPKLPFSRVILKGNKMHQPYEFATFEISVRDTDHQYSRDFKNLLKDYYLHPE